MSDEEKNRKTPRIDSIAEKLKIIAHANKVMECTPDISLTDQEKMFFDRIIAEKAKMQWTDHEIDMATILARTMSEFDTNMNILKTEGSVIYDDKDRPFINPRKKATDDSASSICNIRRTLGLNSAKKYGDTRDAQKRAQLAREVEQSVLTDNEDDLLATPDVIN